MFGMVVLSQNIKNRNVLVQRVTRHPLGAHTEIGPPVVISETELPSRLVQEILNALDAYGEPFDEPKVATLSDAEYKKFRKEHNRVSVTRSQDGGIEVLPERHVRGGFAGFSEDELRIMPNETTERFYATVLEALAKAQ